MSCRDPHVFPSLRLTVILTLFHPHVLPWSSRLNTPGDDDEEDDDDDDNEGDDDDDDDDDDESEEEEEKKKPDLFQFVVEGKKIVTKDPNSWNKIVVKFHRGCASEFVYGFQRKDKDSE